MKEHKMILCADDTAEVPASVQHTAPLMLNPDAHPLMLLSAALARSNRIKQSLQPFVMIPPDRACECLDGLAIHGLLTVLHHQTEELQQILSGSMVELDHFLSASDTTSDHGSP